MKPLIGITSEFVPNTHHGRPWNAHFLLVDYTEAIGAAGGVPVILPIAHPDFGPLLLERLDGVVLTGGCEDVPPNAYGQSVHDATVPMPLERWGSEVAWLEYAFAAEKPVLGICLGMQTINVALGGTLTQDLPTQRPAAADHTAPSRMHRHAVDVMDGTWLATVAPATTVRVVSAHHQALDKVAPGLRPAAYSDDGVLEAVEAHDRGIIAAVQWHPERDDQQPDWLLRGFVRHCAARIGAPAG